MPTEVVGVSSVKLLSGTYLHFKGGSYRLFGPIAYNGEREGVEPDGDVLVAYQSIDGNGSGELFFVESKKFREIVRTESGEVKPRFDFLYGP